MRAALLAACLAAAAPAHAWWKRGADPLVNHHALFAAGKYEEVASSLPESTLQKLRGNDLRGAYTLLGASLVRLGQLDKALSVYQLGIRLFPKDIGLLTGLADLFADSSLEEQARSLYDKVIKLDANNAEAHLGLAVIDAKLGLFDRSAEHYETLLEVRQSPALWRDYAEVLFEQRDFKTAEPAVLEALKGAPNDDDALLLLARIQRDQGRLPEAIATLDRALALASEERRPGMTLARSLWLLEADRLDEATAAADAVLKIAPSPTARWVKGLALLKLGRRDAAAVELKSAAAGHERFVAEAAAALLKELKR